MRLVVQSALRTEVTEILGRERYARRQRARQSLRDGYQPITAKATARPVHL